MITSWNRAVNIWLVQLHRIEKIILYKPPARRLANVINKKYNRQIWITPEMLYAYSPSMWFTGNQSWLSGPHVHACTIRTVNFFIFSYMHACIHVWMKHWVYFLYHVYARYSSVLQLKFSYLNALFIQNKYLPTCLSTRKIECSMSGWKICLLRICRVRLSVTVSKRNTLKFKHAQIMQGITSSLWEAIDAII